jgi:hypothetical protein
MLFSSKKAHFLVKSAFLMKGRFVIGLVRGRLIDARKPGAQRR